MKSRLKILLAFVALFASQILYAQQDSSEVEDNSTLPDSLLTVHSPLIHDSGRSVVINWEQYAEDTSLTYVEITTLCDSLFALAGLGKPGDSEGNVTIEPDMDDDNTCFLRYSRWKQFWAHRSDAETGKIFGLKKIYALKTTGSPDYLKCDRTSPLQSSLGTFSPGENVGWQWVGPEKHTGYPECT